MFAPTSSAATSMPSCLNFATYSCLDLLLLFVTNSSRLPAARKACSAYAGAQERQRDNGCKGALVEVGGLVGGGCASAVCCCCWLLANQGTSPCELLPVPPINGTDLHSTRYQVLSAPQHPILVK